MVRSSRRRGQAPLPSFRDEGPVLDSLGRDVVEVMAESLRNGVARLRGEFEAEVVDSLGFAEFERTPDFPYIGLAVSIRGKIMLFSSGYYFAARRGREGEPIASAIPKGSPAAILLPWHRGNIRPPKERVALSVVRAEAINVDRNPNRAVYVLAFDKEGVMVSDWVELNDDFNLVAERFRRRSAVTDASTLVLSKAVPWRPLPEILGGSVRFRDVVSRAGLSFDGHEIGGRELTTQS